MPKEKGKGPSLGERTSRSAQAPTVCKEGKGVRNFACTHYDHCLDKAAKAMWGGFTCKECVCYCNREEEAL